MKKNVITLITILISTFCYGNTLEEHIKELEEAAYKKALELKQISEQIRKVDTFWKHFGSCFEYTLRRGVKRKLKKTGIEAVVDRGSLDRYCSDVEVEIKRDCPISFTIKKRPELRNFLLADKNELHIKTAINDIEDSIVAAGNDCSSALAGQAPFGHDLTAELFDLDNFDLLKFFCVQSAAEMYLLKHLVIRYQKCLDKLIEINNELLILKQEEN